MTLEEFLIKRFGGEAFTDVQPAKENKLPDNAAEVWKMDKEKQIEEMAKILYEPYYEQESDVLSGWEQAYCERKAEALYNAGYGKLPQWVKINPETMSIDAQIEECRACQAEHDKLEAENDKLKDRISALQIDTSQFEKLENENAVLNRALENCIFEEQD